MKRTIKLAVVAALALGTTSAFATNGSTLIGLGAKSRGMAGAAIGLGHGAESALSNPALITTIAKDHEISFGGTFFMPDVTYDNGMGAGAKTSDADLSVIPEVSIANKVSDNFYWGVGMWGTAGMGVDYRDEPANFQMVTNLQLMQFGVPLAYTTNNFTVAVTPVLQYGALDINFNTGTNVGAGVAQDLQFGFTLGASYDINNLTVGAVYKSQIDMNYKGQISNAARAFGLNFSDDLSTPAEIGFGVSYTMAAHTIAVDYKMIQWSSAKGYEDFMWDDQDVFAVGYEYNAKGWALRAGFNYASSPISDQGVMNTAINTLNILGFPAIIESHYAVGGTYELSTTTSVDMALTYAPEVSETYTASNYPYAGTRQTEVTHSQTGVTLQLNYAF